MDTHEKLDNKIIIKSMRNKEKDASHPTDINTQIKIYYYYIAVVYLNLCINMFIQVTSCN